MKMKLSEKQKEVIEKMREGWSLIRGVDDVTGRYFYMVTKGFERVYFNMTVYGNLLNKKLIYSSDDTLTELGRTINL